MVKVLLTLASRLRISYRATAGAVDAKGREIAKREASHHRHQWVLVDLP
jgi:hypothetical protein